MGIKKQTQLGMNPSTASNKLVKDILWKLIVQTERDTCYKCGDKMSRESFSIEHIQHWLDSDNPVGNYFNLDNISFTHHRCNVRDKRDTRKLKPCGTHQSYDRGCRCEPCKSAKSQYRKSRYSADKRKLKYEVRGT